LFAPALAPREPDLIDASVGLDRRERGWCSAPRWKGSLDDALFEKGTRKAQQTAAHLALGAAAMHAFQNLNREIGKAGTAILEEEIANAGRQPPGFFVPIPPALQDRRHVFTRALKGFTAKDF